jgi:hypothetical protein
MITTKPAHVIRPGVSSIFTNIPTIWPAKGSKRRQFITKRGLKYFNANIYPQSPQKPDKKENINNPRKALLGFKKPKTP